ncbi:hypothetical protein C8R47DRAFT_143265 [Mycena vitilis]|nr:hypothetical protein C8R47DRAFT_143265 [Mycena vitilis]
MRYNSNQSTPLDSTATCVLPLAPPRVPQLEVFPSSILAIRPPQSVKNDPVADDQPEYRTLLSLSTPICSILHATVNSPRRYPRHYTGWSPSAFLPTSSSIYHNLPAKRSTRPGGEESCTHRQCTPPLRSRYLWKHILVRLQAGPWISGVFFSRFLRFVAVFCSTSAPAFKSSKMFSYPTVDETPPSLFCKTTIRPGGSSAIRDYSANWRSWSTSRSGHRGMSMRSSLLCFWALSLSPTRHSLKT